MKLILFFCLSALSAWASTELVGISNESSKKIENFYVRLEFADENSDQVFGPFTLDPGGEVEFSYDVTPTTGSDVSVTAIAFVTAHSYELDGNSYVGLGSESEVEIGSTGWSHGFGFNHGLTIYSFDIVLPTPDSAKTLWLVEGDPLDAKIYREGIDKVVYAMKESQSSPGGTLPGDIEQVSFELTGLDETAGTLALANTAVIERFSAMLVTSPSLFSGNITGGPTIDLEFPALAIMGIETDAVPIVIDASPYEAIIVAVRTLLFALLSISFFFSCLELIKGAFAEAKTFYWLSKQ